MARKLTKREKGFVKDIANGESGIQAVKKNYNPNNSSTAASMAYKILARPEVHVKIMSIADSIPDELLTRRHLELLNVPKITKKFQKGKDMEIEESLDVQAIKAGLDMAYKIKGTYAPAEVNMKFKGFSKDQLIQSILGKITKKK